MKRLPEPASVQQARRGRRGPPVIEVAPEVFRLGNRLFNWYLVREKSKFTLIDGGLPAYWGQLVETLEALGATLADVEAVLLTHAHLDHLGLVARVADKAAARIYLNTADSARARRGGAQIPPWGLLSHFWRKGARRILGAAVMSHVFFGRSISGTHKLCSEPGLDVPGGIQVLETPGHTLGSVSFYHPYSGSLFTGDSFVTLDMRKDRACPPCLTPVGTHDDESLSLRSLSRFDSLGPATLLPGHGEPWKGDAREAVELARRAGVPRW